MLNSPVPRRTTRWSRVAAFGRCGVIATAGTAYANGKQARVWYADTTNGQCVIRDMTNAARKPDDSSVTCSQWGFGSDEADPRRGVHWQTSVRGPAVVYGDFKGVTTDVARVDVTGPDWTRSFRVEKATFAGEVPAEANGDRVRFIYRDVRGAAVARDIATVGIESE